MSNEEEEEEEHRMARNVDSNTSEHPFRISFPCDKKSNQAKRARRSQGRAIKWRWISESEDPPPCVSLKFLPIPWIWGGGDWLRGIESHLHSVTLFQWLSTSRERPYREMEALGGLPDDFKAAEDRKWKRRGWFPETTSYVS